LPPIRETYQATIEAGTVGDSARLELPDRHLWLYPEDGGRVTIEWERKNGRAELGFATTRELIEELYARMVVQLAQPEHKLDLAYRTVDS
jgi:hypothetical protein